MESFLKEVANYYKLEKKFLLRHFTHTICWNAIFSGLTPLEMENSFRNIGKMILKKEVKPYEAEFLSAHWNDWDWIKEDYFKITNGFRKKLVDNFKGLRNNDLVTVVYNFVDMLACQNWNGCGKELASDDKAYRSLTLSWFKNSPLWRLSNRHKN
jgi:hypothetical protein